jgi:pimeloyl-ACP methyl ester carboxylesterase
MFFSVMARSLILPIFSFLFAHSIHGADGLSLHLALPPIDGERFQQADFHFWVADPGTPIRAVIIHQHGCTNASPEKHPSITGDWHWRALARKHSAALLVPMYQVAGRCDEWNDPDSGSERALFAALEDFAQRSSRPELKDAPWVLWGHSGGSSWSAQMILRHPQRVLAASFRGGCSKQFEVPEFRASFLDVARELPLLFVWGLRESTPPSSHYVSWVPMNTMFDQLRKAGGHVTRVIDPRSEHGCDDSRMMSIPFFDAILSGQTQAPALMDIETLEARPYTTDHQQDPNLSWMPNAEFAALWREFSTHGTLRPQNKPTQTPSLTLSRNESGHTTLNWIIIPDLAGGLRGIRIYRDDQLWKELAIGPTDFLGSGRDSAPEVLRSMSLTDDSPGPHLYKLSFLDAANQESNFSAPVTSP